MAGLASKTYNPSIQADFQLGLAASGGSGCRNPQCSISKTKKIVKGSLRIARMEPSPNGKLKGRVVPKWVHLECCAPVILREAVDRYDGIEQVPGFSDLEADKQLEVVGIAMAILGTEKGDEKKNLGTEKEGEKKKKNQKKDIKIQEGGEEEGVKQLGRLTEKGSGPGVA